MASPGSGVSLRSVKLKVLYTFDINQKDNHLARWPHSLEVQTAFIDGVSQIGVINLRTCLETVITASPELISTTDNDFTIYAYDYSEPDTPLVGQGMLSKALSVQNGGSDSDNEMMVTGRITKNVMGLFSKNAQETLEVKLRFTPVPVAPRQHFRSGSVNGQDFPRSNSPMDTSGLEAMQRIINEGGAQRDRSGSFAEAYDASDNYRPGSGAATPTLGQPFNPPSRQTGLSSRPGSRQGQRQMSHARRDSFNSGYYSGEENGEDGPTRKRAKITKVDWPGRSDLNIERQPDSLRVKASTASSVRLHRPIPINPSHPSSAGINNEEPVRPPTPLPNAKTGRPRGRPRKVVSSNLMRGTRRGSSPAIDLSSQAQLPDVSFSSPEETRGGSAASTPANIPSSPPLMMDQGPLPTSPALPPLAKDHDSGFMSGTFDDLFGDEELLTFDEFLDHKAGEQTTFEEVTTAQHVDTTFTPVFEETDSEEKNNTILPPPPPSGPSLLPAPARQITRAQSFTPGTAFSMSSPKLAPVAIPRVRRMPEEQQEATLPGPVPASEPNIRTFQRSQTWGPEMSDAIMSEAPTGDDSKPKSKKRVGKEQTRARLENAIAAGEMPPFCDNCGAIETPAWRRAYARMFNTPFDSLETTLDQGGCCFKEAVEFGPNGSIKVWKGYKVERRPEDNPQEWYQICLCNPCGLWFHKNKYPRPAEKWQKQQKGKNKRSAAHLHRPVTRPSTSGISKSDALSPGSNESSPGDTATDALDGDENNGYTTNNDDFATTDKEPSLPPMPRGTRSTSADPAPKGLSNIDLGHKGGRTIQSSPIKPVGSEAEPIEIDLTPKNVRRQLFPSPSNTQRLSSPMVAKVQADCPSHLPAFVRRSPRLNKSKDIFHTTGSTPAIEMTADGKENISPIMDFHSSMDDLFGDIADIDFAFAPQTPTPKRRSERLLFKTPSSKTPRREFGQEISANLQDSPSFQTPRCINDSHPVIAALLGTIRKDLSEMTPPSRYVHDLFVAQSKASNSANADVITPQRTRQTQRKVTPTRPFDFPDLPSLKNSSPLSGEAWFHFSELTTDRLQSQDRAFDPLSTDGIGMTSSPPSSFHFPNPIDFDKELDMAIHIDPDEWESMIGLGSGCENMGKENAAKLKSESADSPRSVGAQCLGKKKGAVDDMDASNTLAISSSPVVRRSPRRHR